MDTTTNDLTGQYPSTDDLDANERHDVLSSDRRRIALAVLADRYGPVELECLAQSVAAAELDGGGEPTPGVVRTVAITLHHAHLPKLSDYGLLSYDPESRCVDPTKLVVEG